MLHPATVDAMDGYWAAHLNVARSRLRPPRPLAIPHGAELADYRGMFAQGFGGAPLVSLPRDLLERYGAAAAEASRTGLLDDGRWQAVFGNEVERVVGPAIVACADAGTLRRPTREAEVRLLDAADGPLLDALRSACTAEEWAHAGGIHLGETPVIGAFVDGALAAAAGYTVWGGIIAHLGIVTHPAHRGHGLGGAAVVRAAEAALEAGLVPQYRTLASNLPSMRIARRMGFIDYAASVAVRLRGP